MAEWSNVLQLIRAGILHGRVVQCIAINKGWDSSMAEWSNVSQSIRAGIPP